MQIIKDGCLVVDEWQLLPLDALPPFPEGKIVVPHASWLEQRMELLRRGSDIGVCINGDVDTEEVAKDLSHFGLIAVEFPAFTDGRSYTHARLLRERYHFKGEIRAVGDVLRDQLFFMQRCGINSFQLRDDQDPVLAVQAFKDFSVCYQSAADEHVPIYRRR